MKVKKLIRELKKQPRNMEVKSAHPDSGWGHKIDGVGHQARVNDGTDYVIIYVSEH